jgi:hypothetical protein
VTTTFLLCEFGRVVTEESLPTTPCTELATETVLVQKDEGEWTFHGFCLFHVQHLAARGVFG